MLRKGLALLETAVEDPRELMERIWAKIDIQRDKWFEDCVAPSHDFEEARNLILAGLEEAAKMDLRQESAEEWDRITTRMGELPGLPFTVRHNAGRRLAEIVYSAVRVLQPEIVVETGVAYGVTSALVLTALDKNAAGKLYSIDLPPLADRGGTHIGTLVPEELRYRWSLYRGSSRVLLPRLLEWMNRGVDIFIHDSLHTRRHILFELRTIMPRLRRPSIVIVDDAGNNRAFLEWVEEVRPTGWALVPEEEKKTAVGLAVFRE